jgi:dTDP-glucose 4,6-dehydratase
MAGAGIFETGLEQTVAWYLANRGWWQHILARGYQAERIGVIGGKPAR